MRRIAYDKVINLFIVMVVLIIILLVGIGCYYLFFQKDDIQTVEITDSLDDYGYVLENNETYYYNSLFMTLKEVVNADIINESEYAVTISKLFIADYFNLENKLNKNDIGGTQFIYKPFKDSFISIAKDSIYNYLENNINTERNQELPIVTNVEVVSQRQEPFSYNDTIDELAFYIDLNIDYESDLGYQSNCSLVLIHVDSKLEIVKMQ